MALDARTYHLGLVEQRLNREIAANGMPYDIAVPYFQSMLSQAAHKWDAEIARRRDVRERRKLFLREHQPWPRQVLLDFGWEPEELDRFS